MSMRQKHSTIFFSLLVGFLAVVISGCLNNNKWQKKRPLKYHIHELEARLIDIAIPVGAQFIPEYTLESSPSQHIFIAYQLTIKHQGLVMWYVQEMERLGWHLMASYEGKEQLLIFEKPDRLCIISIRNEHNNYLLVISAGNKEAITSET